MDMNEEEYMETFNLSLKKKKKKIKEKDQIEEKDEVDEEYNYVYLLNRIFSNIRENNPYFQLYKKLVIPPPQLIGLSSNKKTMICNFSTIVSIINRSIDHVKFYFFSELNAKGSIDSMNRLIIKGKFVQRQIESIFKKYINEYVICDSCKKSDTILTKDQVTRIYFMKCNICNSSRSVESLKNY